MLFGRRWGVVGVMRVGDGPVANVSSVVNRDEVSGTSYPVGLSFCRG